MKRPFLLLGLFVGFLAASLQARAARTRQSPTEGSISQEEFFTAVQDAALQAWNQAGEVAQDVIAVANEAATRTINTALPRGLRNNNPGNIRKTSTNWKGEVEGTDAAFETFDSMELGVRALAVNLKTYQSRYGLRTIRQLINRWAPPNENDTSSYVRAVALACGVSADADFPLDAGDNLYNLTTAIIRHENGVSLAADVIRTGVNLA